MGGVFNYVYSKYTDHHLVVIDFKLFSLKMIEIFYSLPQYITVPSYNLQYLIFLAILSL